MDLVDAGDPVEAAAAYDAASADELCFLDITASQENRGTLLDIVRRQQSAVYAADGRRWCANGGGYPPPVGSRCRQVSINTAAVRNRQLVREASEKFGAQCIVVCDRCQEGFTAGRADRWEIFTHGGRNATGIDAVEYAQEVVELGAGEILLTSMDRDGTKSGFDVELTRAVADSVSVPVIASGGVGTLDHLVEGVKLGHASAVLAASIFHFGTYTIGEAKRYMAAAGIPVRIDTA